MNINANEIEKEHFSIEDVIVSYSSIKIVHVNDNKPPMKVIASKIVVCIVILSLVAALFII